MINKSSIDSEKKLENAPLINSEMYIQTKSYVPSQMLHEWNSYQHLPATPPIYVSNIYMYMYIYIWHLACWYQKNKHVPEKRKKNKYDLQMNAIKSLADFLSAMSGNPTMVPGFHSNPRAPDIGSALVSMEQIH